MKKRLFDLFKHSLQEAVEMERDDVEVRKVEGGEPNAQGWVPYECVSDSSQPIIYLPA